MAAVDLHSIFSEYQCLNERCAQLDQEEKKVRHRLERARAKRQRLMASEARIEPGRHHKRTARILVGAAVILLPIVAYFYILSVGGLVEARQPGFDGHFDIGEFLAASPINLVLAAGCVVFIAAAKILAGIYCELNFPKWFFLTVGLGALILSIGNGIIIAKMAADNGKIADYRIAAEQTEGKLKREINRLTHDDATVAACSGADQAPPECAGVAALKKKLADIEDNIERVRVIGIQAIEFWWRLIALLGEVLIAGVAFCYDARSHARQYLQHKITLLDEIINGLKQDLAAVKQAQAAAAGEITALLATLNRPFTEPVHMPRGGFHAAAE
jgi:hypothetical protein